MLKQIKGNSYYFDSRICIGVHISGNEATLIDTGLDEDYARKVYNSLSEKGIKIANIINTHAHGDHYGGNAFLKKRTGCKIYASFFESAIMQNPFLEPVYLYGAEPIDELKEKFFMGESTKADFLINEQGSMGEDKISENTIGENKIGSLGVIRLPGHSPGLIGICTEDKVIYASDSFFTEEVLSKYKLPYIFDVGKSLATLEMLKNSDYDYYLVSHGGLLEKVKARVAIEKNIYLMQEVLASILSHLQEKDTSEGVLDFISGKYGLYVTIPQYFLNFSIVKSYLSYLKKEKKVSCFIEGKRLFWKRE